MDFRQILMAAATEGGGWSPYALGADLLAFWDAEQASTLTLAGSAVTTWADAKNGYAPTQATSGFKPVYSATSFNNRPGVTFDGTDDYLELGSVPFPVGAAESEVWALVDQTSLPASTLTRVVLSYGGDAGSSVSRYVQRVVVTGTNRASARASSQATDAAVDFSGRHVLRATFGATATTIAIDGGSATSVSVVPATLSTRTRLGAASATTPLNFWQGPVSAVLVTNPLSAAQAAQLTTYLKTRGGIA